MGSARRGAGVQPASRRTRIRSLRTDPMLELWLHTPGLTPVSKAKLRRLAKALGEAVIALLVTAAPAAAAPAPELQVKPPFRARPLLVSGTDAYRAGEYLYQDYLLDDHGADTVSGLGSSATWA